MFNNQWSLGPAAIAFAALLLPGSGALFAGDNYAFLVAVSEYDPKELNPLPFTRNDIQEFHQALRDARFKPENIVHMHDDLQKLKDKRYLPLAKNIREEFALLMSVLEADDSLIVAFAGHGVQFEGEAASYFCAADARLEEKDRGTLVSLKEIYQQLEKCPARQKLLLVDACRNDPQSNVGRSRASVRLESITRPQAEAVPQGLVAFFSCAAGQRSFEHPELKHGIFFHHVLKGWQGAADNGDGKLTLTELASYTARETKTFARLKLGAAQTPHIKAEFTDEWILRSLRPQSLSNTLEMKLVLVNSGEFMMGSSGPEPTETGERPQHRVRITRPFYIGAYEVTVGNFHAFVEAQGDRTRPPGGGYNQARQLFETNDRYNWQSTGWFQTGKHPVVNVSWNDAVAFCDWLGKKEKKTYRLPTEAEWEYACRAGTTTLWSTGDTQESLEGFANVADASFKLVLPGVFNQKNYYDYTMKWNDRFPFTAPVGSFRPNAWGLYDMQGNVQEWCADWHGMDYYRNSPLDDPKGPATGTHRVKRGGEFLDYPTGGTATFRRSEVVPDGRGHFIGFRVVREIDE